jgi:two-component system cell cycle response regulator CtrA
MRLLLIEDDPSVAGSIELMLGSEDFQVETARLGEDGVSLGRVNDYGLIVLDLNLPDISGYDVLRSLRTGRQRHACSHSRNFAAVRRRSDVDGSPLAAPV